MEKVTKLASESCVVIFNKSSCCTCDAMKSLFTEIGEEPVVHELEQHPDCTEIETALAMLTGNATSLPAIFIGSKFLGSVTETMALHLTGKLVNMITRAKATVV